VIYLPNNYNTVRKGDVDSAILRASKEVVKNGIGTVLPPSGVACGQPMEVQVCQVPNKETDLEVIITEHLDVVLLSALGVQPITLVAAGQAEYDPPVGLTSRQSYLGDAMECSPSRSQNTNTYACDVGDTAQPDHLQSNVAAFDGPAELKEWGDPYVYCAEGPELPSELTSAGPDPNTTLSAYNGMSTNHPQWPDVVTGAPISQHCGTPGPNPGNPDQQPGGFTGPVTSGSAHPMGYNYVVNVATSGDNSLWINNAGYVPHDLSTAHPLTLDHFLDPSVIGPLLPSGAAPPPDPRYYMGPNGEGIGATYDGVHHDAPLFYFTLTYTLHQVRNVFDRSGDVQLAQETFPPYDATSADLAFHGCTSGQVYNPLWNGADTANWYHKPGNVQPGAGCVAPPPCMIQTAGTGWCPFSDSSTGSPVDLTTGVYRLVIEATGLTALAQNNGVTDYNSGPQDGYGQHGYAMKLCAALASTLTSGPVGCDNGTGKGAGGFNVPPLNITGWNDSTFNLIEPLTQQTANLNYPNSACVSSNQYAYSCYDLACIPTVYAGRTINVRLFNPGTVTTGDLYIGIVTPPNAQATVTYPSYVTTTLDGDVVVQSFDTGHNNYRPYHGLWLNIGLQLSPNYVGDCRSTGIQSGKSGWWQLVAISPTNAVPNSILTNKFTLVGSPVHLVTPA
jgi:hypothetical protein